MLWDESTSAVFRTTKDPYGCFSNMWGGEPFTLQGVYIRSTEALYQALRFPRDPEWQKEILDANNGRVAKMKAKKDGRRRDHSRPDWEEVKLDVMRRCLLWKHAASSEVARLLRSTKDRPIVEISKRDDYWGAVETKEGLEGENWLGRLWMEVRAGLKAPAVNELVLVGIQLQ